jgi:hypothetical protein
LKILRVDCAPLVVVLKTDFMLFQLDPVRILLFAKGALYMSKMVSG